MSSDQGLSIFDEPESDDDARRGTQVLAGEDDRRTAA